MQPRSREREETFGFVRASRRQSPCSVSMRVGISVKRGRRLTGWLKRKYEATEEQKAADIERRGVGKREREKPEGERRCQKRKFPGGGGGERARQGIRCEEGKHGPCAGNYHLGVSRNRLLMVTNPIQSNLSHLPLHTGKSFPLLSHSRAKGCRPRSHNSLGRIDESGEHFGLLE